jgi:medium-chain acyl-[acyl-carrier-protein] hydrolase
VRLFCFSYAGGSASTFRGWPTGFPADIQVCPIELPGRGTRFKEPPSQQLVPLARAVGEGILPYLDRPFAIFGHSMGGRLGFEVCRDLEARFGIQPLVFFASGTTSPEISEPNPAHNLPDDLLIARLRELNQSRPGTFDYPELLQLMIPVLRADLSVSETYVYKAGPRLLCPMVVLGGISDLETTQEGLQGWKQYAISFKMKMFPGDHFFINTAKTLVLKTILDEIRTAQPQTGNG